MVGAIGKVATLKLSKEAMEIMAGDKTRKSIWTRPEIDIVKMCIANGNGVTATSRVLKAEGFSKSPQQVAIQVDKLKQEAK